MDNNNLIKINNLAFKRNERCIFKEANINIRTGKITAIMGPSGCGKTTLLRLIGGQLQPLAGEIYYQQACINRLSRKELYEIRQHMGMLFQSGALFSHLSAFENVAFPLREHTRLPEALIRNLVLMKMQLVGLRGAKDLMPNELSGGMARRVALARAIVMDPELIMYDEPFAGQDPISMGVLVKLIRQLNDILGMTTIIVSHDIHETLNIADYVYVISEGIIVGEGTAQDIKNSPSPLVQQFINGLPDGAVPFHYPAVDYKQDLLNA